VTSALKDAHDMDKELVFKLQIVALEKQEQRFLRISNNEDKTIKDKEELFQAFSDDQNLNQKKVVVREECNSKHKR
jgi:hypothetical protein